MTFGPDEILMCPSCRQVFSRNTYDSGSTMGSISWSDGDSLSPMMPDGQLISSCGNCGRSFFTEDARHVGYVPLGTFMNEPFNMDSYDAMKLEEFKQHLADGLHCGKSDRELSLRLKIWWKYNDELRYADSAEDHSDPVDFCSNLEQIYRLTCQSDNPDSLLLTAETLRELKRFEDAVKLLDKLIKKYKDDPWKDYIPETAEMIKNQALKGNFRVFRLSPEESPPAEFPTTPPAGGLADL